MSCYLPEICEQFARIYLFADDAKLFKHVICDEDHKALQLGLNALHKIGPINGYES